MRLPRKIHAHFIYLFILFLPWQTRFILTPLKPEFLSFSIYLSEIFLWLAIASRFIDADFKKGVKAPFVFLSFCLLILLGIGWSQDKISVFRLWLYIFDGIFFYLYLREYGEMRTVAMKLFLFSLFAASLFGIWQFANLGSPALKWLGLAERGAWNLGDIVVESGGRFLRAYGPFPHPNIFGGYLAAGIIALFIFLNIQDVRRPLRILYAYGAGGILFLALFFTFSRSAWLALGVALIYVAAKSQAARKFFLYFSILAVALSIIFWPLLGTRVRAEGRLEAKSNTERVASWKEGLGAWIENPILGAGAGNNTTVDYGLRIMNYGQVRPAHNIFILILSELGVVGFAICLFLWKKMWRNSAARPLLILFFVIGLFDHYLWTLYSGQMLFWAGLAMTADIQ